MADGGHFPVTRFLDSSTAFPLDIQSLLHSIEHQFTVAIALEIHWLNWEG
jgi:hypothetical protein